MACSGVNEGLALSRELADKPGIAYKLVGRYGLDEDLRYSLRSGSPIREMFAPVLILAVVLAWFRLGPLGCPYRNID